MSAVNDLFIEAVERTMQGVKEVVDDLAHELNALWNPETRKYEPHDRMVMLHDAVNDGLVAYNRLKQMKRRLEHLEGKETD